MTKSALATVVSKHDVHNTLLDTKGCMRQVANKKECWDSRKRRRQQILFCDIQIKVVISHRQIYVYYTDLLPLKILVTLTFQGHLRLTLIVPLDSPYMVSY